MFSPLGNDMPLFSRLERAASFTALIGRVNVPQPIGRVRADQVLRRRPERRADRRRRSCRRGSDLLREPRRPARRLLVHGRLRQDRHRPRARPDPVRRRRAAAAVAAGDLLLRVPRLDRRRPLRPDAVPDPADQRRRRCSPSSDRPTTRRSKARWRPGTRCLPGSAGVIVLPGYDVADGRPHRCRLRCSSRRAAAWPSWPDAPSQPAGRRDFTWSDSLAVITGDIEVTGVAGPPARSRGVRSRRGSRMLRPVRDRPAPRSGRQLLLSGVWLAGQLQVTGAACTIQVADSHPGARTRAAPATASRCHPVTRASSSPR